MADEAKADESPEGAAVLPLIPPEIGVHPALLAAIHAYVFLEGSEANVVNPAAADEALNYIVGYLARFKGPDLTRLREDMQTLVTYAKSDKWPKQQVRFLQDFLKDNGIGD